jgi:protein subunit release factor A
MSDEPSSPPPIPDSDDELLAQCRVETFRAGGPGGQHQNTTDSAVRLVHLPTGVRVVARDERSQHRNRQIALLRLREKLEALATPEAERIPTRVPPKEKKKRLVAKKHRSRTKRLRKPPEPDAE